MKNIVICGSPDRGKSNLTKQILKDFQCNRDGSPRENCIFDINNEYGTYPNLVKKQFKKFPGIREYLAFILEKEGTNNVLEEASAFFSSSGSIGGDTINMLSRRHHTNCLNIMLFHSLRKVPLDILDYVDFFFMFRTEDMPDNVIKKFKSSPGIVDKFLDVRARTNGTQFNREQKKYLPGFYVDDNTGQTVNVSSEYSKNWFHYSRVWSR